MAYMVNIALKSYMVYGFKPYIYNVVYMDNKNGLKPLQLSDPLILKLSELLFPPGFLTPVRLSPKICLQESINMDF